MIQEIHGWFFDKRCELWNQDGPDGRTCPILEVQKANYRQIPRDTAVYFPEAIYGNLTSSVIFLGANPGQVAIEPNETEEQRLSRLQSENDELASCPNSITNQGMDLEAYTQHHLSYNIQHPAELIVSGAARILQRTWDCSRATALSMVTLVNVAHCKCPKYLDHFARMGDNQDVFWNTCGARTLKTLSILQPKAVVCLGDPVKYWTQYVHNTHLPGAYYAPWTLAGDLEANWYCRTIPLENAQAGIRIPLVTSYHPANYGLFNNDIDAIAGLLRAILFGGATPGPR